MFHTARIEGEITLKIVGYSVLEYPLDFFNDFIFNNFIIKFFTHYKLQLI